MAVTAETLRLLDELRGQLDQVVDTQARDLTAAWADAWGEVSADLRDVLEEMLADGQRITRTRLLRSQRLQQSLAIIAGQLQTLARQAGVRVTGDLQAVVSAAATSQATLAASQLPPGTVPPAEIATWAQPDPGQLAAVVARSTEQITSLTKPLSAQAYAAVRLELIRGVAAGSNPRETARRMVARSEGRFNGGLHRALTIARTETLDAYRESARVAQTTPAVREVLAGWEWNAKLDARTCPACWAMHGQMFDVTEPGPLGHQQCRCARLPKTKSWADLGFDVEEPEDLMPDAGARFEALSPAEQSAVLGPKRYQAWLDGIYPIEEWAARRTTPGWRDSYVVSPAPSGGLAAASLAS